MPETAIEPLLGDILRIQEENLFDHISQKHSPRQLRVRSFCRPTRMTSVNARLWAANYQ